MLSENSGLGEVAKINTEPHICGGCVRTTLRLICIPQQINHTKVKKLFLLSLAHSESSLGFSHPLQPPSPPSLRLRPSLRPTVSSRHWEALTLINGELSSALKARGSKWRAQIKVEHRRQGMEGGERSTGHTHQSLSASPSQGDSRGGRGWRGQRRFIGLNLTLVQARHIVPDKLFTCGLRGSTQTH